MSDLKTTDSFDPEVEELFHRTDLPEMSVDPGSIIAGGRRTRARRRSAAVAGLASLAVAAGGVWVGMSHEASPQTDPAGTSTSAAPSPTSSGTVVPPVPEAGASVRLGDIELPKIGKQPARTWRLEYGMASPGHPALGHDPESGGPNPVLRVGPVSGGAVPSGITISHSEVTRPEDTVVSTAGSYLVVIAPAGAPVSLHLRGGVDIGGTVSDSVDLPGGTSAAWVIQPERPIRSKDLVGAVVEGVDGVVLVRADGTSHDVTTVSPGKPGDKARLSYSSSLDLLALRTGDGSSSSRHPSEAPSGTRPGGVMSTDGPGERTEQWVYVILPGGTTTAELRAFDSEPIPLRLTKVGSTGTVVGYAHQRDTPALAGDLLVAWEEGQGAEHTAPLG